MKNIHIAFYSIRIFYRNMFKLLYTVAPHDKIIYSFKISCID